GGGGGGSGFFSSSCFKSSSVNSLTCILPSFFFMELASREPPNASKATAAVQSKAMVSLFLYDLRSSYAPYALFLSSNRRSRRSLDRILFISIAVSFKVRCRIQ